LKLAPIQPKKSIVQTLSDELFDAMGVQVLVKREDLIHPQVSGNKWRKLKYTIAEAKKQGKKTLLTFGGAYSNHILATAAIGKLEGFRTIGIIRGEEHSPLNTTLEFAQSCQMQLEYMDRTTYREKNSEQVISQLQEQFGDFFLIPEGGTNQLALKGCAEIAQEVELDYDYVCTACGTGGTLAGIIAGLDGKKKAIGFPVLKGADFLETEISQLLAEFGCQATNWELQLDYHFGGYAKKKPELKSFIDNFQKKHQLEIEFVYTAKLFFGIYDLIRKGYFEQGSTVLAIHTGGLRKF
jgi:1-aminocyclopropane-1-carboxylate deaminase